MDEREHEGPSEDVIAAGDAETVKRESARRTRRSFLAGGVAAAAGFGIVEWINHTREIGRQPMALRRTFQTNASISRTVFDERGLAPTYPLSEARPLRLNGNIGMDQDLVLSSWRLQLAGVANPEALPLYSDDVTAWEYAYGRDQKPGDQSDNVKSAPGPQQPVGSGSTRSIAQRFDAMRRAMTHKRNYGNAEAGPSASGLNTGTPGLLLTLDDVKKLPRVEIVTEFKCIEGWSEICQWGGVRLRDLIDAYPPEKVNGREPRYLYMETPEGNYYGGYDMSAARHPQSLLVTEMGGQPLTQEHGAPLRLHMPIKYGYKQLKRIALIRYMDTKPDDYWTKLGYDWFAGL